jgi:hypothetical protein
VEREESSSVWRGIMTQNGWSLSWKLIPLAEVTSVCPTCAPPLAPGYTALGAGEAIVHLFDP